MRYLCDIQSTTKYNGVCGKVSQLALSTARIAKSNAQIGSHLSSALEYHLYISRWVHADFLLLKFSWSEAQTIEWSLVENIYRRKFFTSKIDLVEFSTKNIGAVYNIFATIDI